MNEVTRRDAVKLLAAGAVGAAAGGPPIMGSPAAAGSAPGPSSPSPLREGSSPGHERSWDAARRMGGGVESNLPVPVRDAWVMHCRCWDGSIYLSIDPSTQGFVQVGDRAFAIAAACQAAGRPVAVKCWGHDPDWAGGVGRFDGAILAIDRRDLEPQPPPPSVIG